MVDERRGDNCRMISYMRIAVRYALCGQKPCCEVHWMQGK
jgi:hypothetical protein